MPVQVDLHAALALHRAGDLAGAEAAYRSLLKRHGAQPDAEHMLAVVLHALGRSDEALPWFERAETARAGAAIWNNHAAALLALGRGDDALRLALRATQADPHHGGAWLNLGFAHETRGEIREAIAAFEHALAAPVSAVPARRALARCLLLRGDAAQALATLAEIAPGSDRAADLLRAEAMIELGDAESAALLLPEDVTETDTHTLMLQAQIALQRGHSDAALAAFSRANERDPDNRRTLLKIALLCVERADAERGLRLMRAWLERNPYDNAVAGNYLVACNYSARFDAAALLAEQRRFAPPPPAVDAWPAGYRRRGNGKLRIGWVATAFSVGPLEIFFANVLDAFARVAPDVQHILYAIAGQVTSPTAPTWARDARDLRGRSTAHMVETIRADGVDVLVDMVGRAAGNRIGLFAARAAPVQVGWMDVFYSTGLPTMDYVVTDRWLSPPHAENGFSERLLRLDHGRLAYTPPPAEPGEVAAASIRKFVSLNRFSKISDEVLDVWTSILNNLPEWSLLLKAHGIDDDVAAGVRSRFARRGIDPARIEIERGGTYAQAMATYNRASIALDPFPFSGCSTTCDALWMGLPVVTWPRDTMASRQTAGWLELAGKPEWIAHSADAYVARAVALANDEAARVAWRRTAREVLAGSICDSERLARELIAALRGVAST